MFGEFHSWTNQKLQYPDPVSKLFSGNFRQCKQPVVLTSHLERKSLFEHTFQTLFCETLLTLRRSSFARTADPPTKRDSWALVSLRLMRVKTHAAMLHVVLQKPDEHGVHRATPLHLAAMHGHVPVMRRLLRHRAPTDCIDSVRCSPPEGSGGRWWPLSAGHARVAGLGTVRAPSPAPPLGFRVRVCGYAELWLRYESQDR